MKARERYEEWLKNASSRSPLYKDLISIDEKDNNEIEERFHQYLTFGTAGLRGKVGAGTNRMNFYMVGKATQGIANYIKGYGQEAMDRGVVIAHDPRHFSKDFSRFAAGVFAAAGIKAYIFPDLRPTPELAYMIGKLHTISGVNITASHNPKDYNGYKVYWEDGCQVSSTIADGMLAEMDKVDLWADIHYMPVELALEEGKVIVLGEEYDRDYLDHIESLAIHEGDELDLDIPLVYTPLNGCGAIPFAEMMKDRGFTNWHMVKEQIEPDPDFTTVGYPNPEDPKAFRLSEELGRQTGAELLMATDPDADRFAIELRDDAGNYIPLNGNQTGAMLIAYMAQGMKETGRLPEKGALIKSIVTGDMGAAIARSYGIEVFEALTGFKNICGKIHDVYDKGYSYFFGYEESIGCAPGEAVRDKDGVCCAMLVAEMTAWYRKRGMSLTDGLEQLYQKYGYYSEDQVSLVREGAEGAALISRIMDAFRDGKPEAFGPFKVERMIDYIHGYQDIPASNVLRFDLGDNTWFAMRPSGTEPKIKFYYYAVADNRQTSSGRVEAMKAAVDALIQTIR